MTDKFSLLAWETYLNVTRFPEHEGLTVADVKAAFLAGAKLHEDKLDAANARIAELEFEIDQMRQPGDGLGVWRDHL